jgi:hypothetical protein
MLIQIMVGAALFYHVGAWSNTTSLYDVNRGAYKIFLMRIEQIWTLLEQL